MQPTNRTDWTFLGALMDALKMPDETTAHFAVEVKKLNDEDKAWYKAELHKAGYNGNF